MFDVILYYRLENLILEWFVICFIYYGLSELYVKDVYWSYEVYLLKIVIFMLYYWFIEKEKENLLVFCLFKSMLFMLNCIKCNEYI